MKRKYIPLFLFSFLLLLVFPLPVFASSEPTKNFASFITVQEDGSIKVVEMIELNGDYNGLNRDVQFRNPTAKTFSSSLSDLSGSSLYNGSSIDSIKVGRIDTISLDATPSYFQQVAAANKGEDGVYTVEEDSNGVHLQIFHPSSVSGFFYLEYVIRDVVVIHNDTAEFAWNVLGDGYQENISQFSVSIVLPQEDRDLRTWLHGPLNGSIVRLSNGAKATYSFLGARNAVSVRLLFNKDMVPYASKYSHLDAVDEIIQIETKLADEANAERAKIRRQNDFVKGLSLVWLAVATALTIVLIKKSHDSKKVDFQAQYYRDFPADYGPEVLEYLIDKKIDEKALSATILNLIYKKVLTVEERSEKHKKDYALILEKEDDTLNTQEKAAIHLLIEEAGNGKEVLLSSLKKYCSKVNQAQSFMNCYQDFLKSSRSCSKSLGFYQKLSSFRIISMFIILFGLAISVLSISLEVNFFFSDFACLFSVIYLLIVATRRFFTPKGALDYAKWMAHKRFLKDFGRMDEKQLPEVRLWDKYLVYAVILGCADELSHQMQLKIKEMDTNMVDYPYYDPYFFHANIYSSLNRGIAQAVSSSRSTIAASQSSSGSGFGGGASGGGGSFGGGGGGGRF